MRQASFVNDLNKKRFQLEDKYARNAFRVLRVQYKRVIEQSKRLDPSALYVYLDHAFLFEDWENYYLSLYGEAGQDFGYMQLQQMNSLSSKQDEEEVFYISYFEEASQRYARTLMGTKITGLNQTTRDRLKRIVQRIGEEALEEGQSVQSVARAIRRAVNDDLLVSRSRAMTIARTEITNAQRYAQHEGAVASGIQFKRFWSTSGLPNIRDSHVFAEQWSEDIGGISDNQVYNMGDGTTMRFVGDPQADPSQTINCRCSELFEPVV